MLNVLIVGHSERMLEGLARNVEGCRLTVLEDPDVARKCGVTGMLDTLGTETRALWHPYYQAGEEYLKIACEEHRRDPFHVVLPCHEYAVLAAAKIAASCGLRGSGVDAARVLTDKLELREALAHAGLPHPWFTELHSLADLRACVRPDRSYVLKPANRHASLGVQFVDSGTDLEGAWLETTSVGDDATQSSDFRLVPDHQTRWRYMLEERMSGPEVSVEALLVGGEVTFLNITAKHVFDGSRPVEQGHVVPARLDCALEELLAEQTGALARAVGFQYGVMHAEWIITADGPIVVECAGRLPGDSIVELIAAAYDVSLPALLVMALAGLSPEVAAKPLRAAAIGFLHSSPGVVREVTGLREALDCEGVEEAVATVVAGDIVRPLRCSWDRVGHVRVTAPDAAAATVALHRAIGHVQIMTEAA